MPDELRDQFPKVREVVAALGFPVYEREGFEADDVIATLVGQAEAAGLETTIVTGDLDMLQLVTERTRLVVSLRGGVANTVVYDLARIDERWGLRPDQMLDYKALKGDATDNIPGVPGVGEKTAAKLVGTFGTLDALYERIDEVTPEKLRPLLLEAKERVLESRELQRLVRDVPVDPGPRRRRASASTTARRSSRSSASTSSGRSSTGSRRSRARRPRRRRPGRRDAAGRRRGRPGPGRRAAAPRSAPSGGLQLSLDFDAVGPAPAPGPAARRCRPATCRPPSPRSSPTRAASSTRTQPPRPTWGRGWRRSPPSAWRCVLDDPRPRAGTPLALALAGRGRPRRRVRGTRGGGRRPPGPRGRRDAARRPRGEAVAGRRASSTISTRPRRPIAFDTQVAAYLLNASLRSQGIADVVHERLDVDLPPAAAGLGPGERAALEALGALAVRVPLAAALEEQGLGRLFAELELPLIPILARMEATGVALDLEALAALDREFGTELARLEAEIYADVGHEFNLGSPKQLEQVLFYELNLPKGKRTKTGYSTDATVLEELRAAHPMVGKLLDWRLYAKLRSTYVQALPGPPRRRRAAPHDVPPGRRRDGPPLVVGPEPAEHPDPDRPRAADPAGLRGRRARRRPRLGRLQPDRAADPGPRVGRRAPQGGLRRGQGHPPRQRRAASCARTRPT